MKDHIFLITNMLLDLKTTLKVNFTNGLVFVTKFQIYFKSINNYVKPTFSLQNVTSTLYGQSDMTKILFFGTK